jgi:DNA-binding NarL/FixJ family response regulator
MKRTNDMPQPTDRSTVQPTRPISLLVADDHAMVRELFVRILNEQADLNVVAEAADGQTVLDLLTELAPRLDVLMLDLTMPPPDGLELIGIVRRRYPALHILVVSMHSNPNVAKVVIDSGAHGYITKDCYPAELFNAIRTVAAGERYMEKRIMEDIIFQSRQVADNQLTPREVEVLRRLARGQSNGDIARELFLSEKTVSTHKSNLMGKLGLRSMVDLIRYVHKHMPENFI